MTFRQHTKARSALHVSLIGVILLSLLCHVIGRDAFASSSIATVPLRTDEKDLSIIISTIDGGIYTVDAWTGEPKVSERIFLIRDEFLHLFSNTSSEM